MSASAFVSRCTLSLEPVFELHNMSVPSRTVLTVARQTIRGRRYRVDLEKTVRERFCGSVDDFTQRLRQDGSVCMVELLANTADAGEPRTVLKRLCEEELAALRMPQGFGYFVEEPESPFSNTVSTAAAVAILAARSGPLYVPGRFEPSLINLRPVTLFFPSAGRTAGTNMDEEQAR